MRKSMHGGCVSRSISKWLTIGLILCFVAVMAITGMTLSIDNVTYSADVDTESIGDDTATTAAEGDTFTKGLPNGTKYFYTDWTKGQALSDGGSGTDKTPVTVVNPSGTADGTQTNPFVISTKDDWETFRTYVKSLTSGANAYGAGKYFVLNADLDYTDETIMTLTTFNGTFYGCGHFIKNADIDPDASTNATSGLFGTVNSAYISDLNIQNYTLNTTSVHSAPLVGNAYGNVTVANCATSGTVTATSYNSSGVSGHSVFGIRSITSGLVSYAEANPLNIYKCATDLTVNLNETYNASHQAGGVIGNGSAGIYNIYDCYSSNRVTLITAQIETIGGGTIAHAWQSTVNLKNCVSVSDFKSTKAADWYGAVADVNGTSTTMSNCFAYHNYAQIINVSTGALKKYKVGTGRYSGSKNIKNTYIFSDNNASATDWVGVSNGMDTVEASSVSDLWSKASTFNASAKTGLNPAIWIASNVSKNTSATSPIDIFENPVFINKTKIAFVDYKGNAMTLQDGKTGNVREYQVTDVGNDLPEANAPGGDTANYTFRGWTTDKDSTDKIYTTFENGLYCDVTMYAVWDMKNTSVTVEGSKGESFPFTATYTGDTLITLKGKTNAPSSNYNVSYEWFKGTTSVKKADSVSLSLVAESGQYKVKCTITDKENPLWIGTAESSFVTVTIDKCTPVLITGTFGIDSSKKPYVNRQLSELTISSTTQAGATATATTPISGKFSWSSSIAKVQKGTNNVKIKFEPDDKVNYVSPVLLDVTFESVPLLLTFDMQDAISQTLTYEMEYNNEYDTAKIAAEFLTLFTKACTDHPVEYADASSMTPVLEGKEINEYKTWNYKYKATAEKTIKVTFKEKKYNVTYEFNDDGHTANKVIECNYNQFISKENLNWEGHELEGWYVVKDKAMTNTKWDFINDRVTDDLTLRAKWVAVTLELESIEIKLKKTTYTALEKVTEADITVIGHFMRTDDNNKKSEKEIAFDDLDITYESTDNKLHVQKPGFTVSYTYDGVTKEASPDPAVKVNPIKIDVSGVTFNDKSVVYTGTVQTIDKIALETLDAKITDVTYEYSYNGNTVPKSDVKELGDYTVIATFVVTNPDYVADPETLSATLSITREKTKLTVEWDTTSLEYNGSAQHPTPIFKRADGTVANVSYNLTGDTDATDIGTSYTVTAELTTNGFVIEGNASVTFAITKAKLDAPTLKDEPIIYNGNTIYLAEFLNGYDAAIMEITGDASKTDVSNVGYTAYIGLTNDNYEWKSGNNTETVNWNISKRVITINWMSPEHIGDGKVFYPKVQSLNNLADKDTTKVEYTADFLYGGDTDKSEYGSYSVTVTGFSNDALSLWARNYEIDPNSATRTFVIIPNGAQVISIVWRGESFKFNGRVQAPEIDKILDAMGNEITDSAKLTQIKRALTLSGDAKTSVWAGEYEASVSISGNNYYILDGAKHPYEIVLNDEGEGENPGGDGPQQVVIEWSGAELTFNGHAQAPTAVVKDLNGNVLSNVTLTYSGDTTAIWEKQGGYTITAIVPAGYTIQSGATFHYNIVANNEQKGGLTDPENPYNPDNTGNNGGGIPKDFPLWQTIVAGISIILTAIFLAKTISNANKEKKYNNKTKQTKSQVMYASAFGTEALFMGTLGLEARWWSTIALGLLGLALIMFTAMLVTGHNAKKAELAYETAQAEARQAEIERQRKEREEEMERQRKEREEAREEERRQREEERRQRDEEYERQRRERDEERRQRDEEMKMMFMMLNNRGGAGGSGYEQTNVEGTTIYHDQNIEQIVQRVVTALLPSTTHTESAEYAPETDALTRLIEQQSEMIDKQARIIEQMSQNASDDDFDDEEDNDYYDEEDDFYEQELAADGEAQPVYEAEVLPDEAKPRILSNFRMRLKVSSVKNHDAYVAIKNKLCSKKEITFRISGRTEKVKYHGEVIAIIGVARKSLKLWLALDPNSIEQSRYHQKDVSDKPRYAHVPMLLRVGSDRALKRAMEVLDILFETYSIEDRRKYKDKSLQELAYTLKRNALVRNKRVELLRDSIHVHDADALTNEEAAQYVEYKAREAYEYENFATITLDVLEENFYDGQKVTLDKLKHKGLIPEEYNGYVITTGERLTKPLYVVADGYSAVAVKMIVLTGGRAIQLAEVTNEDIR